MMKVVIDTHEVETLLGEGQPVHMSLLDGYLDIERPLPVLVIHRTDVDDDVTPQLLFGQSALLVVGRDAPSHQLAELVRTVARVQADAFGAFLVVELWSAPIPSEDMYGDSIPFRVVTGASDVIPQPASVLAASVEEIRIGRARATVDVDTEAVIAPRGMDPVLDQIEARELGCLVLGLEVPEVYRAGDGGPIYPASLRALRSQISTALQQTFFEFIRVQTSYELKDHRELGRRNLVATGTDVDRKLAEIGAGLDPLFHITPINTQTAFRDFVASGYEEDPAFHYRLLPFDPDILKRKLYELPIEDVTDPTVAALLREKRVELDRMITLLEDRDSPRFLPGCLQLYPPVDGTLMAEADAILDQVPPEDASSGSVSPAEFAARATAEIDLYRAEVPEIDSAVFLRDDMPGIMVSRGQLHLSTAARIGHDRVEALIHHEVGTHIVTYQNGLIQPLLLLSAGLPGYEQTQEGLAMIAEYVSGGLQANRLRTIAARVVAVDMMTRGAGFVEIFRRMHVDIQLPPPAAWSVTMRVTRGGGSSKDAIYLRGLIALLDYLRSEDESALEPLLVGKIALEHVPLIEELLWRRVLKPPRLRPRWLGVRGAQERLSLVHEGLRPADLIGR
jgi:uncharacterized protein (TIGR02421 family)